MNEKLEPFILYRDKARKLLESTFAQEMARPSGVDISWSEDGQVTVHRGPSQEHIDAYLLTFRFFIQGNESISFRNMGAHFRDRINDEELYTRFQEAREALNNFLNGDSSFNINGMVSRRHIMEVFIFGDLSHANYEDKRRHYRAWMADEFLAALMKNEFRLIIAKALIVIAHVDRICRDAIDRHGNT